MRKHQNYRPCVEAVEGGDNRKQLLPGPSTVTSGAPVWSVWKPLLITMYGARVLSLEFIMELPAEGQENHVGITNCYGPSSPMITELAQLLCSVRQCAAVGVYHQDCQLSNDDTETY